MTRLTKENLIDRVFVDGNGCWIWKGATKNPGTRSLPYGWITYKNKQMAAHRAAWIVMHGDIPHNQVVCHRCDVPKCVNPDHLFLGTPSDNMKDMWAKGRHVLPTHGVVGSRSSKLDLVDVKQVIELLKEGHTQRDIGKKFGVTQSAISLINTRKNWSRYV